MSDYLPPPFTLFPEQELYLPNIHVNVKLFFVIFNCIYYEHSLLQISFKVRSELGTSVLTDIVMSAVAVHVVPEVVTEDRAGDFSGLVFADFRLESDVLSVEKEKILTRRGRGIP